MIWLLVIVAFGVNLTVWAAIGFVRLAWDSVARHLPWSRVRRVKRRARRLGDGERPEWHVDIGDIAVLIPAHNEALVIADTITAIAKHVPIENVHIVSDGSHDETAEIARATGANVLEISPAGGKARALKTGIAHFGLRDRYRAVLLLDADTRLDDDYFVHALPLFDDPEVAAVAGCATTAWHPESMTWRGQLLAAHRERVYVVTQLFGKYGQTWRYTNVTPIVPGFASLYRTRLLGQIEIDAPGLVIEDFNMTFEVHHRGLGRVAFTPDARAYTQDPHRVRDYSRQVRRWVLGFWQTVRRHRVWISKFWAALALTIFELLSSSIVLLASAFSLIVLAVGDVGGSTVMQLEPFAETHDAIASTFSYEILAVGILLPDYVMTCVVAAIQRRPRYLLLGVLFVPLRLVDSVAALVTLPKAWLVSSDGRWTSPERRATAGGATPETASTANAA